MKTRGVGRYAVLLSLVLAIGACRTRAIEEPQIHLTTMAAAAKLSEAQIGDAIVRAGKDRRWEMEPGAPGHITGTLRARDRYLAVTDITYSKTDIRIAYKTSEGLDYEDGKIHKAYNKWVNQLAAQIRKQLTVAP